MTKNIDIANDIKVVDSLDPVAADFMKTLDCDQAFWIADFDRVRHELKLWQDNLSRVKPFYAVKCCNEPKLLQFLVKNYDIGYDCASIAELKMMVELGVNPAEQIVYTHPIKEIQSLKYAKEHGIKRLVYDTEDELKKIMKYYPEASVFIRVKPTFSNAKVNLSEKFGVAPEDVHHLLQVTKDLGANFIGIAFHVGSLCDCEKTFKIALQYASQLRDEAAKLGLKVSFVDIGGGYLPSTSNDAHFSFPQIASAINDAINEYFPDNTVQFTAEPGRYIGSEYMDLYLPIICDKFEKNKQGVMTQHIMIPDGLYGCFLCGFHFHDDIIHYYVYPKTGEKIDVNARVPTILWGQTCDSNDCIYKNLSWPKLHLGDIIFIRKFSAYSYAPHSFFNGFPHHVIRYIHENDSEMEK